MHKLIFISFGAVLGALSRFCCAEFLKGFGPWSFPLPIFLINFLGSLGLGLLVGSFRPSPYWGTIQLIVAVGFFASFTTFSTFSLETVELLFEQRYKIALLYVSSSVLLCVLACGIGLKLGSICSPHINTLLGSK